MAYPLIESHAASLCTLWYFLHTYRISCNVVHNQLIALPATHFRVYLRFSIVYTAFPIALRTVDCFRFLHISSNLKAATDYCSVVAVSLSIFLPHMGQYFIPSIPPQSSPPAWQHKSSLPLSLCSISSSLRLFSCSFMISLQNSHIVIPPIFFHTWGSS